jgi:alkylation response protein AidB-like acyl-CoA dehydrogenase
MNSPESLPLSVAQTLTPEWAACVETLCAQWAQTAVARDAAGGHAAVERQALRDSGLLRLSVPRSQGGGGAGWPVVCEVLRRFARVDSALAHLFGFHHLQLVSHALYGTAEQYRRCTEQTVTQQLFWGNALNPLDQRLLAVEVDGGFELNGVKSYASGSVGSDRLLLSGWHVPTQTTVIGAVPTNAPGVTVRGDWNAFGQRQTDSGTVQFEQVFMPDADVLIRPGAQATPRTTLRSQFAQSVLVNIYLGLAEGALAEARQQIVQTPKPWLTSGVAAAVDDPFIQHRYAELQLLVRPAQLLADAAALKLQAGWERGSALTAEERGEAALAVAEAKVLAHRAAMEVSSQFFELAGARATSRQQGLDRFWRNARVHTLHDPVDYKLRDIGRHALTGRWPEPSPYS